MGWGSHQDPDAAKAARNQQDVRDLVAKKGLTAEIAAQAQADPRVGGSSN